MKIRIIRERFGGMGWRSEPEVLRLGGVGTAGAERLEFELPTEWAGMAVTLTVEQEGGTRLAQMLLDEKGTAAVDGRFTGARQGLWALSATDGAGRWEMTRPGRYVCYQTIGSAEGESPADSEGLALEYQMLERVLRQEARAALAAQEAAWQRDKAADRCAAREKALLLEALAGMRYADAGAWELQEQLAQRWNSPPPERAEPKAVERLEMESTPLTVRAGESCTLSAAVLPGDADQTVEWMAVPEGVVEITGNTLTARKSGDVTLTALAGGKMAQRPVHAVAVALDGLTLDRQAATVKQGGSVTLTATLSPADSTVTAVSWEVDDPAAAALNAAQTAATAGKAENVLAALKEGSCTVTARAGGLSAACTVTIEKAEAGGGEETVLFAVTNQLTGCTTSCSDIIARSGAAYTAVLTLERGFRLSSIHVKMGSEDVTDSVWDSETRTISVPQVTGNLVIAAAAKLPMLKELAEGEVLTVAESEDGEPVEFIAADQNYEEKLNGAGRTLLIRKAGISGKKWNTTWATYDGSLMDNWLNGSYLNGLPEKLREILPETKIYYTPGYDSSGGSHTVTTMSRKVFLPSSHEFGFDSVGYTSANSAKYYHNEGTTFAKAEEISKEMLSADRVTTTKATQFHAWTRTPYLAVYADGLPSADLKTYLNKRAEAVSHEMGVTEIKPVLGGGLVSDTTENSGPFTMKYMTHPAFTLPGNAVLDADGRVEEVRKDE